MIRTFRDTDTFELYRTGKHRKYANIAKVALRKLDLLETAVSLQELREPPGNRLEALLKDRAGQHSIRINDQYRLCFVWKEDGFYDVEITDYH